MTASEGKPVLERSQAQIAEMMKRMAGAHA